MKQRIGSPAHNQLVHEVKRSKKALVGLLEEGSRDYDVMQQLLDEYKSFQSAADHITGQTKE